MAKTTNTESYEDYIASYYIDEKEGLIHYLYVGEECGDVVSCGIRRVQHTPIMLEQVLELLPEGHDGESEPSLQKFNSIAQYYEQEIRAA